MAAERGRERKSSQEGHRRRHPDVRINRSERNEGGVCSFFAVFVGNVWRLYPRQVIRLLPTSNCDDRLCCAEHPNGRAGFAKFLINRFSALPITPPYQSLLPTMLHKGRLGLLVPERYVHRAELEKPLNYILTDHVQVTT